MTKFVKGNEAVVMGALYAGCELYFGYPITPASEIAHGAAKWFPMLGRTFVQAECETASVNMMFGAAAAGKLCMTATSGPGFSLMQEGSAFPFVALGLPLQIAAVAVIAVVFLAVALLVTLIPMRQVSRIDPASAMSQTDIG